MIFAFLSRRLRAWLLLTVALPLVGRALQVLGGRAAERSPRIGRALTSAGEVARSRSKGRSSTPTRTLQGR